MDCDEFKELAPAFALGALEELERAACAAHLASRNVAVHAGCEDALGEAQAVAGRLASLLPPRQPHSRVWDAIEDGVTRNLLGKDPLARAARLPRRRRPAWRELGGWVVAAAMLGIYLYNAPFDSARNADAALAPPPAMQRAAALLMEGGTRLRPFRASAQTGQPAARGSLILNPSLRSAVVLVDRVVLQPGLGLRLWAVRGSAPPVPLARLDATVDGMATAELGEALFQPALPDELLLSVDPPDAGAPRSVRLVARLDRP
jgi:hypothetical protein